MYKIIDLHFQGLPSVIGSYLVDLGGSWALIESGPYSCWPQLVAGLKEHKLTPGDIDHVLLTHIHLDHAGAAWALAREGAIIHVHPAGAPHIQQPEKLVASAKRIYQDQMDILWGDIQPIPESRLNTVGHQVSLAIGNKTFIAHHTPGHAVHHIAWQLDHTLFTGDVAGIKINNGLVAPPCPPPEFQWEDWLASIAYMRTLPVKELVLTHFGSITDISAHFDALESALKEWVQFFEAKPTLEDQAALTADFMTYIHQDFYPENMAQPLQDQYDLANPPWMSVAGISRYLKKKYQ